MLSEQKADSTLGARLREAVRKLAETKDAAERLNLSREVALLKAAVINEQWLHAALGQMPAADRLDRARLAGELATAARAVCALEREALGLGESGGSDGIATDLETALRQMEAAGEIVAPIAEVDEAAGSEPAKE